MIKRCNNLEGFSRTGLILVTKLSRQNLHILRGFLIVWHCI